MSRQIRAQQLTEFIYRCVDEGTAFVKDERTQIRIGFPSYKLVYEAGCEDVILGTSGTREQAERREEERRKSRWLM